MSALGLVSPKRYADLCLLPYLHPHIRQKQNSRLYLDCTNDLRGIGTQHLWGHPQGDKACYSSHRFCQVGLVFHLYLHQTLDQVPALPPRAHLRTSSHGVPRHQEKASWWPRRQESKCKLLCSIEKADAEKEMGFLGVSVAGSSFHDNNSCDSSQHAAGKYLALLGSRAVPFRREDIIHFRSVLAHPSYSPRNPNYLLLPSRYQVLQLHWKNILLGLSYASNGCGKGVLWSESRFLLHCWRCHSLVRGHSGHQYVFRLHRNNAGGGPLLQIVEAPVQRNAEEERQAKNNIKRSFNKRSSLWKIILLGNQSLNNSKE